jgi:hypothetical protein
VITVRFLDGPLAGEARAIDVAAPPPLINVAAKAEGDQPAVADAYENMDGRYEMDYEGGNGAYLYVHTGHWPGLTGI